MTKEEIIDNIARLNSEIWRDREEVRTEIGKLLAELKKALEQQSIEDSVVEYLLKQVSEQEMWLSVAGYNAYNADIAFKSIIRSIKNMPPITPTQCIAKFTFDKDELQEIVDKKVKELVLTPNWIPTSERQPKENGNYLAFYCTNDGTANLEFMMVDHCNAGGGWLHEKNGKKAYTKVIAWMPLPEPYKEKRGVINDKRTY